MAKCYASKVITVAKGEVGYQEKKSNLKLDSKHENVGSANYTKYGKYWGVNGQAWCDSFVDWCFVQAYGKDKARDLEGGFSAYTPTSANYFKNMNRYYNRGETIPKAGDVIFFYSNTMKRICHTGLVYKVDIAKKIVYTIEGNTSASSTKFERDGGCVAYKMYSFSDSKIHGYGRPKYDTVPKAKVTIKCRLYKKANTTQGSYLVLDKNVQVTYVKDVGNGWSEVKYDSKTGYVKNTCINKGTSKYRTGKLTVDAHFRKSNSIKSKSMRVLPKGKTVTVVCVGKYWTNVKYNGVDGFISTKKLKIS